MMYAVSPGLFIHFIFTYLMDRDDFDGEIIDLSDYDYNFINDVNIKCINKPISPSKSSRSIR
jgi:hypothetical protein